MENKGTNRLCGNVSKDRNLAEAPARELMDAHELAGQLEELLRCEAEILKRFRNQELLSILHQKESLIQDLARKLKELDEAKNGDADMAGCPQFLSLQTRLKESKRLNRSNQIFIEGTLSHYRHFIDCLIPANYSPRHENEPRQELAAFKGLTFRKEI